MTQNIAKSCYSVREIFCE